MNTITFDTLKLVDTLERGNVPRDQARAIVEVVRESCDVTLAEQSGVAQTISERLVLELDTKTGRAIAKLEHKVDTNHAKVIGSIKLSRWMLGTLIAVGLTGMASLIIKTFF